MYRFVYADNAATTQIRDSAFEEMLPFLKDGYGNPSSIYSKGREAAIALKSARERIAGCLGAKAGEIIFTSGGTESDNMAIRGIAARKKKGHIITSKIEHHAVLNTVRELAGNGFEVTELDVSENGLISMDSLRKSIRQDTILITIMTANNEIGTIQPIKEIAELAREKKILFHTDAVQAVGHIPINVKELGVDMLSLSSHKFGGPKGIGALYLRGGVYLKGILTGGGQEGGKRGGTESVGAAIGMAAALECALAELDSETARITQMRDKLIRGILDTIPYSRLNGDLHHRLPSNVNVSIEDIEGESLILLLDIYGVCASSGSACTTGSLDPSHVLLALGLTHEVAHGSLRLSLGNNNTEADVDYILNILPKAVNTLRELSPLWEKRIKAQK